jgi:hypothetical protein
VTTVTSLTPLFPAWPPPPVLSRILIMVAMSRDASAGRRERAAVVWSEEAHAEDDRSLFPALLTCLPAAGVGVQKLMTPTGTQWMLWCYDAEEWRREANGLMQCKGTR